MSLYTKARRHIDMNRVKELREEKIKKEKIAEIQKQQEEIFAELAEIEKEESKYVNWRKELNEMTTADLAYVTLAAEGDVDLVPTTDNIVNGNFFFKSNWSALNGVATSSDSSDLIIPGATNTVFRRADMKIPVPADKNISTVKVTVSKGGGTVSWTDRDPSENFNANLSLTVDGQSLSNVQSGVYTFTIDPGGNPTVPGFIFIYFSQFAKISATGQSTVKISFQRRTPVNVFVSLDDPVASAFVRDGDFDRLSNAEKKKKLEEQLRSSDEYLNKMFGEGMPKGATTIADTEPQQSYGEIASDARNPMGTGDQAAAAAALLASPMVQAAAAKGLAALAALVGGTGLAKQIMNQIDQGGEGSLNLDDYENPYKKQQVEREEEKMADAVRKGDAREAGQSQEERQEKADAAQKLDDATAELEAANASGNEERIERAEERRANAVKNKQRVRNKWKNQRSLPGYKGESFNTKGEVIKEKKSFKDLTKKIPGYYDGKPSPLGFPVEEPPKMKNGFHPDFVSGKKVANRFNRLDPQSAKAMPKTGNSHVDKKVRAAAKKPK